MNFSFSTTFLNIQINLDYTNAHSFPFYHPGKSHVEFELCNVMGRSLVQAKATQRSKSCRAKGLTPVLCRDSGILLAQWEQDTEQRSSSSLGCSLGRLGGQNPPRVDQPPWTALVKCLIRALTSYNPTEWQLFPDSG